MLKIFLKQQCLEGSSGVCVCIYTLILSLVALEGMKDILNKKCSNNLFFSIVY